MNWYWEVLKKYAVFKGRARRKEYWMFFLFNFLVSLVVWLVSFMIKDKNALLVNLYNLAIFLPSMAVAVRRLHDTGRSGRRWLLYPMLIFFLFGIMAGLLGITNPTIATGVVAIFVIIFVIFSLVWGIWVFVLMVSDSTPGPNRYGPNPKETDIPEHLSHLQ